ncbi:MAG: toprim domain-containing protein, partial [Rhodospirillaceae bacterium]
ARAREPARQQGALLVVEGYMDVIALAEHGIEHAVAPLGTAMTEDQLRLAWKAADRVVLCFDGDKAGRKAAERALRRALPLMDSRRRLLICLLPEGQDPDDLVRQAGVDGFHRVADAAQDSVEFAWKLVGEGLATGQASPSDFAAAEALVKELSGLIADQDLRYFFTQDLSRRVKDRFYSLTRGRTGQDPRRSGSMPPGWAPGMATAGGRGRRGQAKPLGEMSSVPVLPVPVNADRVRHLLALSCMVNYPGLYGRIEEDFYRFDFADEDLRDAYAFLDELLMAEGPDGEEDRSLGREAVMDRLAVAYPDVAADLLALDRAGHGGFLAPGQDQRRIYSAWRHLLSMLVVEEMRRDLIAAMDRFGAEQTYESLAHLQTISAMVYASYEVAEEEGAA